MPLIKLCMSLAALAAVTSVVLSPRSRGAETALVVHVGNDPANLRHFERWLGCRVQGVAIHTGQASWDDWSGSIGFQLNRWRGARRELYWSIPLIPEGATLSDAGSGAYDGRYATAAREIAAGVKGDGPIRVRTGWEFNTDHMPWASHGRENDYGRAFRRFVDTFRSVSTRFRFEWTPNIGGHDDPALSYPGDAHVDLIGMDAYYNTRWDSANARLAWLFNVERPFGFRWLEAFAHDHDKPTAYAEWGVMAPGSGGYVEGAAAWFDAHRPIYQSYWDSDSSFKGKLSDGAMPLAGAAYRSAFASCREQRA